VDGEDLAVGKVEAARGAPEPQLSHDVGVLALCMAPAQPRDDEGARAEVAPESRFWESV
jgi:hypothetical protein